MSHWSPHVTVAAIVERDQRFLLVEENSAGSIVINQPAGHWEFGETLIEAVTRETLEETGYVFNPTHLVGIYQWTHPLHQETYLRFAFTGELGDRDTNRQLDSEIIRVLWWTSEEIEQYRERLRSPQVMRCLQDYLIGTRYELDCLTQISPGS